MTKSLIAAISKDDTPAFRALLRQGCDCDDYYGLPLLIHLVRKGRTEMVRLLLKHGGDANLRDFNGRTALHHLVGVRPKNEVAIAKLLMSFGANPRIRENNGATPMELCSYGAFEVAKICYAGHRRVPRIPRYSLLAGPCFRVRRIE